MRVSTKIGFSLVALTLLLAGCGRTASEGSANQSQTPGYNQYDPRTPAAGGGSGGTGSTGGAPDILGEVTLTPADMITLTDSLGPTGQAQMVDYLGQIENPAADPALISKGIAGVFSLLARFNDQKIFAEMALMANYVKQELAALKAKDKAKRKAAAKKVNKRIKQGIKKAINEIITKKLYAGDKRSNGGNDRRFFDDEEY